MKLPATCIEDLELLKLMKNLMLMRRNTPNGQIGVQIMSPKVLLVQLNLLKICGHGLGIMAAAPKEPKKTKKEHVVKYITKRYKDI